MDFMVGVNVAGSTINHIAVVVENIDDALPLAGYAWPAV